MKNSSEEVENSMYMKKKVRFELYLQGVCVGKETIDVVYIFHLFFTTYRATFMKTYVY